MGYSRAMRDYLRFVWRAKRFRHRLRRTPAAGEPTTPSASLSLQPLRFTAQDLGASDAELRRQKIIAAIRETPNASTRELARRLRHDVKTIRRIRQEVQGPVQKRSA
jgi:hypothetical protein